MRTANASGSKAPKKRTSEDRSRKKSTRSAKRRRDSSSSSYSSSSDDDGYHRPRWRSAGSRSPKRGRYSKKPDRKKTLTRRRRDLSVSYKSSGSSHSSSGGSRSRSLVRGDRRRKNKGRGRENIRKSLQRRRYRSPSCSTCSGYRTRSCSSCSRSHSYKNRGNVKRRKWVSNAKEKEERKREKKKDDSRTEDRAKIIKAYGDFPSENNDAGQNRELNLDEANKEEKDEAAGAVGKGAHSTRVEKIIVSEGEKEPARSIDNGGDSVVLESCCFSNESSVRMKSEVVANVHSSDADDLELILRQKALENFKKFRDGITANMRIADQRDQDGQAEHCNEAGKVAEAKQVSLTGGSSANLSERKPTTSQVEIQPSEVRLRSVVNPSPKASDVLKSVKDDTSNGGSESKTANNQQIPRCTVACSSPNRIKRANESAVKESLEQTSLPKGNHAKMPSGEPQNSNAVGAETSKKNASISEVVASPKTKGEPKETNAEADQFQQKTFSRTHDGEVVQVSYKVYIPKRNPALARRQLQR